MTPTLFLAALILSQVGVPTSELKQAIKDGRDKDRIAKAQEKVAAEEKAIEEIKAARVDPKNGAGSIEKQLIRGKRIYLFRDERYRRDALATHDERLKAAKSELLRAKVPLPRIVLNAGERIPVGHAGEIWVKSRGDTSTGTIRVRQIIDATHAIGEIYDGGFSMDVWLEMDTAGMADDTRLATQSRLFEYTGTKRYETVLGATKTVHAFREVDASEVTKP